MTYTDLYEWGISGTAGSAERKTKLLCALGLPPRLSKKSWWKPSTAFTATSSWTKCSRNCSKHENTANSPKKNVKKIQAILLGNLP
ncbi:MAG: DUF4093 domain-containing protein [Faecalibacterium prausnitzii]